MDADDVTVAGPVTVLQLQTARCSIGLAAAPRACREEAMAVAAKRAVSARLFEGADQSTLRRTEEGLTNEQWTSCSCGWISCFALSR